MFALYRQKSRESPKARRERNELVGIITGPHVFRMKGAESSREKALFRQKSFRFLDTERRTSLPCSVALDCAIADITGVSTFTEGGAHDRESLFSPRCSSAAENGTVTIHPKPPVVAMPFDLRRLEP